MTRLEALRSQAISNETLKALGLDTAKLTMDEEGRFEIPLPMLEAAKIKSHLSFAPVDNGLLPQDASA